jgi:hypothetical protein
MKTIDINCDVGESFGVYRTGVDEAVMPQARWNVWQRCMTPSRAAILGTRELKNSNSDVPEKPEW